MATVAAALGISGLVTAYGFSAKGKADKATTEEECVRMGFVTKATLEKIERDKKALDTSEAKLKAEIESLKQSMTTQEAEARRTLEELEGPELQYAKASREDLRRAVAELKTRLEAKGLVFGKASTRVLDSVGARLRLRGTLGDLYAKLSKAYAQDQGKIGGRRRRRRGGDPPTETAPAPEPVPEAPPAPEVTVPEVSSDGASDGASDAASVAASDAAPAAEATPEATPEAMPEAAPEATPEAAAPSSGFLTRKDFMQMWTDIFASLPTSKPVPEETTPQPAAVSPEKQAKKDKEAAAAAAKLLKDLVKAASLGKQVCEIGDPTIADRIAKTNIEIGERRKTACDLVAVAETVRTALTGKTVTESVWTETKALYPGGELVKLPKDITKAVDSYKAAAKRLPKKQQEELKVPFEAPDEGSFQVENPIDKTRPTPTPAPAPEPSLQLSAPGSTLEEKKAEAKAELSAEGSTRPKRRMSKTEMLPQLSAGMRKSTFKRRRGGKQNGRRLSRRRKDRADRAHSHAR